MAGTHRDIRVVLPERGSVATLLAFGLLYGIVDRATDPAAETLEAAVPWVTAESAATGLALVLWVALAVVAFLELRRQRRSNPRTVGDRDVLVRLLDQHRTERRDVASAAGAAVVGGAIVVAAREQFFAAMDGTSYILVGLFEGGGLGEFSALTFVGGVVFLGGFALFAVGADRLFVAAYRELLYRWHDR